MIYDHSLVDGWRVRIGKEEESAQDTLRKFIHQRKGLDRPASATNDLQYNARDGPWANGGNYGEARFDQPFSDMQERRLQDNIRVWDQGYNPPNFKAIPPKQQTAMLKAKKKAEEELAKGQISNRPDSALASARSRLDTPATALLRISPLTDKVPEPHVKGIRRSWAFMENDPVKIQLGQEDTVHTEGTLENRTMTRLSPLMKVRPKTANPRPLTSQPHFRKTEEGYGNLGEDGTRGGVRLGWITQNMISSADLDYEKPRSTTRSRASTAMSRRSRGSRASSRSSGGGRRRKELETLVRRMRNIEAEIDDVRDARLEIEDELRETKRQIVANNEG